MKLLSDIARNALPEQPIELVHAIQDAFMIKYLDSPILSSEASCPICEGKAGYTSLVDPKKKSDQKMWFCSNSFCLEKFIKIKPKPHNLPHPKRERVREWKKFCEENQIGDLSHDVRFEKIEQSSGKIDNLRKSSKQLQGIILMRVAPGPGKSYAEMDLCK